MTRNIPFLAGACLLSVALGFLFGKGKGSGQKASEPSAEIRPSARERLSSRPHRPRGDGDSEILYSILSGRNMRDIPSIELAGIIAKLSKKDPDLDAVSSARRRYQLQMLLTQLSGSKLEEIATALAADKDAKQDGALSNVLAHLTEKDSDRAFYWAAAQENTSRHLPTVISKLAATDPDRASELLRKGLLDGSISGEGVWSASRGISKEMAKLGALPLLDFLDTIPGRRGDMLIYNSMNLLPEGEQIVLLDELYKRTKEKTSRGNQFQYLFSYALEQNADEAEAWLKSMPDGEDKISLQAEAAIRLIRSGDEETAKIWIGQAYESSPGKEKEIFINATRNMGYNDPVGIAKLAKTLPKGIELTAEDIDSSARNSLHNGLGSLAAVANALSNPQERVKLITKTLEHYSSNRSLFRGTGSTDYEIFSRRINEMGLSGEDLEQVNKSLKTAREKGNP